MQHGRARTPDVLRAASPALSHTLTSARKLNIKSRARVKTKCLFHNLKQNEAQSARAESTHKGVNWRFKDGPESPICMPARLSVFVVVNV